MILPDASTEKAQVAFAGNDKDGIALIYDELTSFFGATSRYANKSGPARAILAGVLALGLRFHTVQQLANVARRH